MFTVEELFAASKGKALEAKAVLGGMTPDLDRGKALLAEAEGLRAQAEALKSADSVLAAADQVSRPDLPP